MTDKWRENGLAHWEQINRLAVRRFGATSLAEEAALFVMDSLAADSWRRLKEHTGKGSLKSYISSLSWRLMEDFSRKRFGRVRPPLWIKKLGGKWPMLFALLCLQRLSLAEAVESLFSRFPAWEKEEIDEAALTILTRIPHCGKQQGLEQRYEGDEGGADAGGSPERLLEKDEQQHLFTAIFGHLVGIEGDCLMPESFTTVLREGVELLPEERLLLRLLYQDNVGVRQAGKLLDLNRDQVNGRLRRLLARLRNTFQEMGLESELLELLR